MTPDFETFARVETNFNLKQNMVSQISELICAKLQFLNVAMKTKVTALKLTVGFEK